MMTTRSSSGGIERPAENHHGEGPSSTAGVDTVGAAVFARLRGDPVLTVLERQATNVGTDASNRARVRRVRELVASSGEKCILVECTLRRGGTVGSYGFRLGTSDVLGHVIGAVDPAGPAGGLLGPGDLVIAVDGMLQLRSTHDATARAITAGEKVEFLVCRTVLARCVGAKVIRYERIPGDLLGLRLSHSGAMIETVEAGTVAESAGFLPGDRIVAINGLPLHRTTTETKLRAIRDTGGHVVVQVMRGGGTASDPNNASNTTVVQPTIKPRAKPPPPPPTSPRRESSTQQPPPVSPRVKPPLAQQQPPAVSPRRVSAPGPPPPVSPRTKPSPPSPRTRAVPPVAPRPRPRSDPSDAKTVAAKASATAPDNGQGAVVKASFAPAWDSATSANDTSAIASHSSRPDPETEVVVSPEAGSAVTNTATTTAPAKPAPNPVVRRRHNSSEGSSPSAGSKTRVGSDTEQGTSSSPRSRRSTLYIATDVAVPKQPIFRRLRGGVASPAQDVVALPATFNIGEMGRDLAEEALAFRDDGAFLLREAHGKLVLSAMHNGQVGHYTLQISLHQPYRDIDKALRKFIRYYSGSERVAEKGGLLCPLREYVMGASPNALSLVAKLHAAESTVDSDGGGDDDDNEHDNPHDGNHLGHSEWSRDDDDNVARPRAADTTVVATTNNPPRTKPQRRLLSGGGAAVAAIAAAASEGGGFDLNALLDITLPPVNADTPEGGRGEASRMQIASDSILDESSADSRPDGQHGKRSTVAGVVSPNLSIVDETTTDDDPKMTFEEEDEDGLPVASPCGDNSDMFAPRFDLPMPTAPPVPTARKSGPPPPVAKPRPSTVFVPPPTAQTAAEKHPTPVARSSATSATTLVPPVSGAASTSGGASAMSASALSTSNTTTASADGQPRRRKLVRGGNAKETPVLPEFAQALSALDELDGFLSMLDDDADSKKPARAAPPPPPQPRAVPDPVAEPAPSKLTTPRSSADRASSGLAAPLSTSTSNSTDSSSASDASGQPPPPSAQYSAFAASLMY